MALDTSIGTAESRSYATVDELDAYVPIDNVALDSSLDEAAKENLLVRAARMIDAIGDREERWPGRRRNTDADGNAVIQRLSWPRSAAIMRDGSDIPQDSIPPQVKDAQCELAVYISANPDDAAQVIDMLRIVKRERIEELDTEYMPVKDVETLRRIFTSVEDILSAILLERINDRRVEGGRPLFGMWRMSEEN